MNAAFCIAMQLATSELMTAVLRSVTTWLPARDIVKASLAKAHEVHPSGKIMVLDAFCPWKDHLFELEGEAAARGTPLIPVLYAVFADSSGSWYVVLATMRYHTCMLVTHHTHTPPATCAGACKQCPPTRTPSPAGGRCRWRGRGCETRTCPPPAASPAASLCTRRASLAATRRGRARLPWLWHPWRGRRSVALCVMVT